MFFFSVCLKNVFTYFSPTFQISKKLLTYFSPTLTFSGFSGLLGGQPPHNLSIISDYHLPRNLLQYFVGPRCFGALPALLLRKVGNFG